MTDPRTGQPLEFTYASGAELGAAGDVIRTTPLLEPLRADYPVEVAFGMADASTIQESVGRLEATGVEEMMMHAGLFDDHPRAQELVWIMLAQRAARGLGSLYAHANEMTMEEAGRVHSDWTPRGWMKTEKELLIFEQHLYLRQPGYGTSYVTGKYLIEQLVAACAQQKEARGEPFALKDFFAEIF